MSNGRPEDLDITQRVLNGEIPVITNYKSWLRHKGVEARIIDEMLIEGCYTVDEIANKIFHQQNINKKRTIKVAKNRVKTHIKHLTDGAGDMISHGLLVINENGIRKIAVPNKADVEDDLARKSKEDIESLNIEFGLTGNAEGDKKTQTVSFYERDPKNRAEAIRKHGKICKVCGFNFKELYGERGLDYIEVHHLTPLHKLGMSQTIDPEKDLTVVCSNCHRMIHRNKSEILAIDQLKRLLKGRIKIVK
jgi:predicted HNH restriction endonuclease